MEGLNLEDFTLVWLDPMTNETDDDYLYKQSCLRSVINYLIIFKEPDECIDYILSIDTEKIFFIISGIFGDFMVPLIDDIQQIASIYIYKTNDIGKSESLIKNYYKVSGIFNEISQLNIQLNKDVISYKRNSMMLMSIFNPEANKDEAKEHSIRDLSKENGTFLWSQLLFETLIGMPRSGKAKTDFLCKCRHQYKDQEKELEKIDDFKNNYHHDLAIKWYTRDSFLYRLLNKAFRIQDIDVIFDYRFFIIDLYDQLSKLHGEFIESLNGKIFTAYLGQEISIEELRNLQSNISHLISMNSFLSTTMDRDVAMSFAGDGSNRPLLESVVFEMEVDTRIKTRKPFANIDKYSYFQSTENEVLFSVGTVFRIESVSQSFDERIWVVKLLYVDDNDSELNDLLNSELAKPTYPDLDGYARLGYLLYRMGDYDTALDYCQKALSSQKVSLPLNHPEKASIYSRMGHIYWKKNDYKQALQSMEKCLEIELNSKFLNNNSIGHTHHNIGTIYIRIDDDTTGLKHFQKALEYYHQSTVYDYFEIVNVYHDIGHVYLKKKEYDIALKNFEKMLDIQLKLWPRDDPNYGSAYSDIGKIYLNKNDYSAALTAYEKQIELKLESLSSKHLSFAPIYVDMSLVYIISHDYVKAFEYLQRAINIDPNASMDFRSIPEKTLEDFRQFLTVNKEANTIIYSRDDNIGQMYIANGDYIAAMDYFRKQLKTDKGIEQASIYTGIGQVYFCQGNFELALENFKKALLIHEKTFPMPLDQNTWMRRGGIYNDLGRAYFNLDNDALALDNYQKASEVQLHLPVDHPDRARVFNNIGLVYRNMKEYDLARLNHKKALDIQKNLKFSNGRNYAETYKYLGKIQEATNDYEGALENFDKAAEIYSKNISWNYELLIKLYIDMAKICEENDDYHKALSYYEKALKVQANVLALKNAKKVLEVPLHSEPNNEPDWELYNGIGCLYEKLGDHVNAIKNLEKALEIQNTIFPTYHLSFFKTYNYLALAHCGVANFESALKYFNELLQVQLRIVPLDYTNLAITYGSIGFVCRDLENYELALINFEKAADIRVKHLSSNDLSLIELYYNIGIIYLRKRAFDTALDMFIRILGLQQKCLLFDNICIADTYNYIGQIHKEKGNDEEADVFFQKAFETEHESSNDSSQKTLDSSKEDDQNTQEKF